MKKHISRILLLTLFLLLLPASSAVSDENDEIIIMVWNEWTCEWQAVGISGDGTCDDPFFCPGGWFPWEILYWR
jgi:hypothetical protein